jgi:hypothetical protein
MFEFTEEALRAFGQVFINYLKEVVASPTFPYSPGYAGGGTLYDNSNKIATGQLYNSLDYSIEIDVTGAPVLVIYYVDYFDYVNEGRRPKQKRVPINALLPWIAIRGIQARDKKGREIPPLSLAFAIQTNIYKFGIKPADIYDRGLEGLLNTIENPPAGPVDEALQRVIDAGAEDIVKMLEESLTIRTTI